MPRQRQSSSSNAEHGAPRSRLRALACAVRVLPGCVVWLVLAAAPSCGGDTPNAPAAETALVPASPIEAEGQGATPLAATKTRQLDVLIVSIDTLRADALSCYGNAWDTSPTIDSLARRGVRFERAYAAAPHTAPSHMTLFTGLLPIAHGISNQGGQFDHVKSLSPHWPTLSSLLSNAGWQVAVAGEGGQLRTDLGFFEGAQDVDLSSHRFSDTIAAFRRFVNGADADRPLFAFLHTYQVHAPYAPPDEFDGVRFHGRFTKDTGGGMFRARFEVLRRRGDRDASMAAAFLDDFDGRSAADVEFLRGLYHENVAYMDHQLAAALGTWDRRRGLANTVVVLVSDHGEQLGERGAFGHREGLEPELTHVPLIVLAPGLAPRVATAPVGLVNVAATVLELVGLAAPDHMAPSLGPALRGSGAEPGSGPPRVTYQQDVLGAGDLLGIVSNEHQYLVGRARGESLDVLYDLVHDPRGTRPLDGERALMDELANLAKVRRAIDERIQSEFPYRRLPLSRSKDDLERLRFLGYIQDEGK